MGRYKGFGCSKYGFIDYFQVSVEVNRLIGLGIVQQFVVVLSAPVNFLKYIF